MGSSVCPLPPERSATSTSLAASGYLEVHHVDNDHHNNENERNLTSLCPFCHSVHHLGFAGAHKRVSLAVIPWLTQEQVSLLCNLCGVAMARHGNLSVEAGKLFQRMQSTSELLEHFFGKESIDASTLAGALSSLYRKNPSLYDQRHKALWMVRVMPSLSAFKEAIDWWSAHTWLPGENWETAWWKLSNSCE